MSNDEHTQYWEEAAENANATFPMQASTLQENGHVVLFGHPCKIFEKSMSRNKVHLVGRDIFTGKRFETIVAKDASVDVPNVHRNEYQLVSSLDERSINDIVIIARLMSMMASSTC
jgi:translation initiation factor 5A